MAARLLTLGASNKPFSPHRLAVAAGRVLTILISVYLIHITREDNQIGPGLILTFGVFVGLYFVFGRRGETRGLVLYIIATCVFEQVRLFADQTGMPVHYSYVINIDQAVFGVPLNHWLQEHLYHQGSTSLLTLYATVVYLSFFANLQLAAIIVWAKCRIFFAPYATAVVIVTMIGLATCLILPTAPPWLASRAGRAPEVHRVVEELSNKVDSDAYASGTKVAGDNAVAAMPSLHMALSALVMFAVWRFNKNPLLRALSVLYVASMGFALIYLGEHYFADEFFGVLAAIVAWKAAVRLWSPDGSRLQLPAMPWQRPGSTAGLEAATASNS